MTLYSLLKKAEEEVYTMKRKLAILIGTTLLCGICTCNGSAATTKRTSNPETLYQVATLQSLMQGNYYGSVSVKSLKKLGDTGLGTFDGLNGEMIVVNGTVYQALADGTVKKAKDSTKVPFSTVTDFHSDFTAQLKNVTSMDDIKKQLTEAVTKNNKNDFYMVKISATFQKVEVRSEKRQKEPYKDLNTVMKTDQTFYTYSNIKGTIVALYCPDYMGGLNTPGWHLHFISSDKTKGGHMLDVAVDKATAKIDTTVGFHMLLPQDDHFKELELSKDLSDEIENVEG